MKCVWLRIAIVLLLFAAATPTRAHETDPYTVPAGREFTELGPRFSRWAYDTLERGVEQTNARIRRASINPAKAAEVEALQTPQAIADAVYRAFPNAYSLIEGLESSLHAASMRQSHPGEIVAFKEIIHNSYLGIYLPIDPRQAFRLWFASNIKVYGIYLGTDKIGHFTDMGKRYFDTYQLALRSGKDEAAARDAVLHMATRDFVFSESGVLGYLSAGQYSNADLAANYLGFLFYRNLTEPVMLKGQLRPALLERDGPYWRIAAHVRPTSDFFSWFFSDHLDEALNPGLFEPILRRGVASSMRKRAEFILWRYRDAQGNHRSPAYFDRRASELSTYWGENYGHDGTPEELLSIGQVCFDPLPADARLEARNDRGYTALHQAVLEDDAAAVRRLLEQGADPDAPVRSRELYSPSWGDTPLHFAARAGRTDLARLLLAAGADPDAANARGATPLHHASQHVQVAALLLAHGAAVDVVDARGRSPLHWAAGDPDTELISLLLSHHADTGKPDHVGRTPLHYAAQRGSAATVAALLAHDVAPDARDEMGQTPLHLAAARPSPAAAAALLRSGADPDAADAFGWTPLHDATRNAREVTVSLLLRAGADPNVGDTYQTTPLHLAARHGRRLIGALLTDAGGDVSRANALGQTPLHEAAFAGEGPLVKDLLARGADPRVHNAQGQTPRDLAQSRHHAAVAALLQISDRPAPAAEEEARQLGRR